MNNRIAVEPELTPVKDYLSGKGFKVETVNYGEYTNKTTDRFDAYVVTGMDTNFLGVSDTNTKAIIIDATGMTPDQVYKELSSRLE